MGTLLADLERGWMIRHIKTDLVCILVNLIEETNVGKNQIMHILIPASKSMSSLSLHSYVFGDVCLLNAQPDLHYSWQSNVLPTCYIKC